MRKTRDYERLFRGFSSESGVCRVRLYEDGAGGKPPVVVLSDLPANTNTSVSNIIEVLAAEVADELGVVGADTRFIEHYPRTARQLQCNIPEEFALVDFSAQRTAVGGFVEVQHIHVGGVLRPSFGTPEWDHVGREEVAGMVGEDIGGEAFPEPVEPDEEVEPVEKASLGQERAREYGMDLSLGWEPPDGDVLLRRVPDFDRGLDLGDHLQTYIQSNVTWTVIHHSPSGFEWGYNGSGPADLALNMLNLFIPPGLDGLPPVRCFEEAASRTAWDLHQDFKSAFIAPLKRYDDHVLKGSEIRAWIEENREQREAS